MNEKQILPIRAGDIAEGIVKRIRQDEQYPGLKTGLDALDEMLLGFRPGDLILLAGDRFMCKTALALSIARHIALDSQINVIYVSPKKTADYLGERMLRAEAGLTTGDDLRLIDAKSEHFEPILEAQQRLAKAPLFITDNPAPTIGDIWDLIIAGGNAEDKPGLIIIDDLAVLTPSYDEDGNEEEPVSQLKFIAQSHRIPILAITPLTQPIKDQENHYPSLSDLPESQVAQADTVLLAYYPSQYGLTSPDGGDLTGVFELIIAKNRYGVEGSVYLHHDDWTRDCKTIGTEG